MSARDHLAPFSEGAVLNSNSQLVSATINDLWSGNLISPIDFDQNGLIVDAHVWTGTNADGSATGLDADGWTDSSAAGTVGLAEATDGTWLNAGTQAGGAQAIWPIYGIVPTAPEQVPVPVSVSAGSQQTVTDSFGITNATLAGGMQATFSHVIAGGTLSTNFQYPESQAALQTALGTAAYQALDFHLAGVNTDGTISADNAVQIWSPQFTGSFTGNVTLTLSYSPTLMGNTPTDQFRLEQFVGGHWTSVTAQTNDENAHTITFNTNSLSAIALAVPEPGTLTLAVAAAIALGCAYFPRRRF